MFSRQSSRVCGSKQNRRQGKDPYRKDKHSINPFKLKAPVPTESLGVATHQVAMVGHSFPRHYKTHLMKNVPNYDAGPKGGLYYKDIKHQQPAATLASKISVDTHYHAIYTHCKDIVMTQDLIDQVDSILALYPDIILANIVSNNLANCPTMPTDNEIRHMANECRVFAMLVSPQIPVIFMGQIPRQLSVQYHGQHQMTDQQFWEAAQKFNSYLKEFEKNALQGHHPVNFRYHSMDNWFYSDNFHVHAIPVSDWCDPGGVHPTQMVFLDKYDKHVRKALLTSKNRPKAH